MTRPDGANSDNEKGDECCQNEVTILEADGKDRPVITVNEVFETTREDLLKSKDRSRGFLFACRLEAGEVGGKNKF